MNHRAVFGIAVASFALFSPSAIAAPKTMTHINPAGLGALATPPPVYVAAPQNVATTTSIQTCSSHAVSFACMVAMKSAYYVLIWDWSNAKCPSGDQCPAAVDGYHVYQNYKLLDSAPKDQTALAFDPKQVGTPCFSVTAYHGSTESVQSSLVCVNLGDAAGVHSQFFAPQYVQSVERDEAKGALGSDSRNDTTTQGTLSAGFKYTTQPGPTSLGDVALNSADRGAVVFDLSSIGPRYIQSAILHLHVLSTTLGAQYQTNNHTNCIAKIGTGQSDWWDNTAWFDGDWFANLSRSDGPDLSIDVTHYVQSWVGGANNYGFIFQGSEENMNAYTENSCLSTYGSPSLEVKLIGT